jgi:hypothetical protein
MSASQVGSTDVANYANTTSGKAEGVVAVQPNPVPSAQASATPAAPTGYVMVAQTGMFNRS